MAYVHLESSKLQMTVYSSPSLRYYHEGNKAIDTSRFWKQSRAKHSCQCFESPRIRCRSNSFHMSLCKRNESSFSWFFPTLYLEFAIISSPTQRWRDSTNNYSTQNGRPVSPHFCPHDHDMSFIFANANAKKIKNEQTKSFAHRFSRVLPFWVEWVEEFEPAVLRAILCDFSVFPHNNLIRSKYS